MCNGYCKLKAAFLQKIAIYQLYLEKYIYCDIDRNYSINLVQYTLLKPNFIISDNVRYSTCSYVILCRILSRGKPDIHFLVTLLRMCSSIMRHSIYIELHYNNIISQSSCTHQMDFSATLIQSLDQPYVLAQYPSYKNYLEIKYLCHYMSNNELL